MADKKTVMAVMVVMLMVTIMAEKSTAYQVCKMSRADMRECKPAVTRPPKSPSGACCNALRKADLKCFCSYKNSSWLSFLGIDNELAATLPARCGLHGASC